MKMNWTVSRNRFDGSRLFRWFHRSISLNCSFPFISNFSWMKLKFFSEHLYGKTSLVSFSNYQPSFWNLKLAVDHCVYVVCTSHAFFVFRRIREIEVNCSVTRRNVCSSLKIEFSPDNLLVFFTVIMAYRMESVSIFFFFFFLRRIDVRTYYYCKNICKNFFEKLNFL